VVELREFAQNIPALPEAYKTLGENGRAWDRYALALHLLGKWGIVAKVEIIGILCRAVVNKNTGKLGVGEGSGSLKGILERLEEQGYVCLGKLGLEKIGFGLNFYRLTPLGEALYQAVEREKPVESEWARLNRLHEGEQYEEHTAACLAFAMHARRRGWGVRVLPEVAGRSAPDVAVMRDGSHIHVEVELSTGREENPAKWQNLAEANQGFVAFCAATEERRERFISACRAEHLPGMATDLKTLATPYDDVPLDAGLWASTW
jgi:DNA-binding PadR family transcriptional regulator